MLKHCITVKFEFHVFNTSFPYFFFFYINYELVLFPDYNLTLDSSSISWIGNIFRTLRYLSLDFKLYTLSVHKLNLEILMKTITFIYYKNQHWLHVSINYCLDVDWMIALSAYVKVFVCSRCSNMDEGIVDGS